MVQSSHYGFLSWISVSFFFISQIQAFSPHEANAVSSPVLSPPTVNTEQGKIWKQLVDVLIDSSSNGAASDTCNVALDESLIDTSYKGNPEKMMQKFLELSSFESVQRFCAQNAARSEQWTLCKPEQDTKASSEFMKFVAAIVTCYNADVFAQLTTFPPECENLHTNSEIRKWYNSQLDTISLQSSDSNLSEEEWKVLAEKAFSTRQSARIIARVCMQKRGWEGAREVILLQLRDFMKYGSIHGPSFSYSFNRCKASVLKSSPDLKDSALNIAVYKCIIEKAKESDKFYNFINGIL